MTTAPTIQTQRLTLRPFAAEDAPAVYEYARHKQVAATTATIPHPYTMQDAVEWIEAVAGNVVGGSTFNFAIVVRDSAALIGAIDLRLEPDNQLADIGYAIHPDCWNRGYVTEAASAIVEYGFETLGLNRIHAHHLASNPASGRVMEKIGMRREGVMRQRICKWGELIDVVHYAILRCDYEQRKTES
ncbi:MAG: GNAT family N-acetyltransferase [Phycisphaerales bacterium]|nr:GNAT family N-acetyltransferase [Phycisphaerales bacterium]